MLELTSLVLILERETSLLFLFVMNILFQKIVYNLLIAWHLIRTSTAGSAKIEKHLVFPKQTVSCSKSKYSISK